MNLMQADAPAFGGGRESGESPERSRRRNGELTSTMSLGNREDGAKR